MKLYKKLRLASAVFAAFYTLSYSAPTYTHDYETNLEKKIVEYVNKKSLPGKDFLVEKVKQHNIVILGETHAIQEGNRFEAVTREESLLVEALPGLKKAGLKYLAVEVSETRREGIEKYLKTGVADSSFLDLAMSMNTYWGTEKVLKALLDVVKTAMENGVEIVYIDIPREKSTEDFSHREAYMAKKVKGIMKKNKSSKMLINIGSYHAFEENWDEEFMRALKASSPDSLSKRLNKEFDCYSIISEPFFFWGALPREVYETKEAIGFDIDEGPVAEQKLKRGIGNYGKTFDGALVFPGWYKHYDRIQKMFEKQEKGEQNG